MKKKKITPKKPQKRGSLISNLPVSASGITYTSLSASSLTSRKMRGKKKAGAPSSSKSNPAVGYAFVVKSGFPSMSWMYVCLDYDCLSTSMMPRSIFPNVTEEMRAFWQRVVIDRAFHWDSSCVDASTMRLVKITMAGQDATEDLFFNRANMKENIENAALSKLNDDEARLLGVEKRYAMMKLFKGVQEYGPDDDKLLTSMRDYLDGDVPLDLAGVIGK